MILRPHSLAFLLALAPLPAMAQGPYQPVGVSDADALAQTVRRLGSNPLDLDALLAAGELSVRLDDLSAAASFFARAEKIDPRSARAKAGEGAILVRSQRPAESLHYFAQAEQFGLAPARFAADRGMAYDLLGDPGRAQRDYRLALAQRPDPETRRRHALSLGIVGRQAQALDELAPLLRSNDRAAWRTRAFVLAMGGDAVEASRIAQTMMPPGAATGLRSFFAELPRLSPVDRAFAVHFGEVRPSPVRLADARLAPRDAPLSLEPLPVRVAAVTSAPARPKKEGRKQRRERERREAAQLAARPVLAAVQPLPQPPAYQAPAWQPPLAATTPVRDRPLTTGELASLSRAGLRNIPLGTAPVQRSLTPSVAPRALTAAEQASLAAATIRPTPPRREAALAAVTPPPIRRELPMTVPAPTVVASVAPPPILRELPAATLRGQQSGPPLMASVAPPPRQPSIVPTKQPGLIPAAPTIQAVGPAQSDVAPPARIAAAAPPPIQVAAAPPLPTPGFSAASIAVTPSGAPLAIEPARSALPPTSVATVAPTISTPATALTPGTEAVVPATVAIPVAAAPAPQAQLAAAPIVALTPPVVTSTPLAPLVTPPTAPGAAAVATPVAPAPRRLARGEGDSILARIVAQLTIPASELEVSGPAIVPGTATPRRSAVERAAAERRAAADKKALAEKKAAADKKALADKEAAAEKKLARSEPPRIWVQVAGGSNDAGLAKAWRAAQVKAPALAGKQGWTTPLRSTNRVLTGPFKTDAEARAHVNQLAKAGVSAFTFTSEAGQKITRLTAR